MYGEFLPSQRLQPWVECFWTLSAGEAVPRHCVLPDGCVDILFGRQGNARGALKAVGAMTRPHEVSLPVGLFTLGVRFRPGTGQAFLKLPLGALTDRSAPLADLWGSAANRLLERLSEPTCIPKLIAAMEAALDSPEGPSPIQRALLAASKDGLLVQGAEELARSCGFSSRHFRRLCLDETGLSPKRLCRILRFQRVVSRLRARSQPPDYASLAAASGYYDQAHLIRDFRELAGCTPGQWFSRRALTGFSNTARSVSA